MNLHPLRAVQQRGGVLAWGEEEDEEDEDEEEEEQEDGAPLSQTSA